jgi:hypothetical protein
MTIALTREISKVQATGANVIALTHGPADLSAIGINLMDSTRRERVLETSLQTSPPQLAALDERRNTR